MQTAAAAPLFRRRALPVPTRPAKAPPRPETAVLLAKAGEALRDTLEDAELAFEAFRWAGRADLARKAMRLMVMARDLRAEAGSAAR